MGADTVAGPAAVRVPRIEPSVRAGIAVAVIYTIIFYGLMIALGPAYGDIFKTAEGAWKGAVIPLAAGSLFLIAFLLWARWDHVLRDPGRLFVTKLMWVPPLVLLVAGVLGVIVAPLADISFNHVMAIVCAAILVGFAEETVFRGILLRGLRTHARSETHVLLISSGLFGIFHLSNAAAGAPLGGTVGQVFLAALAGVALYMARRVTGVLVAGMVVHCLWDMGAFFQGATDDSNNFALATVSTAIALNAVLSIVIVVKLWRSKHQEAMTPTGPVPVS